MIDTLHIELTNRCNLKCPMCPRTRAGIELMSDIHPDAFKNLQLDTFKRIIAVGCLGDALYYRHLRQFFLYAKTINEDIEIHFSTNAVGKSEDWWRKLSLYLPEKHLVVFALDGVDNDILNIYRVGSHYERVVRNMRAFIDGGGKAEWQFILFKHNEHQVDKARELSEKYGAQFALRTSYYYSEDKAPGLRPTRNVSTQMEQSMKIAENKLACRIDKNNEIFVDSFGRILPCCLIATNTIAAEKLTRGMIFNIHKHKIRRCISDYYINGILKMANKSGYCSQRCKVPFESLTLERVKTNE